MDRNITGADLCGIIVKSLSARRAWIEINARMGYRQLHRSLSARRAWIEIIDAGTGFFVLDVALRKESVDRNCGRLLCAALDAVALRKESVDRNLALRSNRQPGKKSLSARRAWIEISYVTFMETMRTSRSPQGERG